MRLIDIGDEFQTSILHFVHVDIYAFFSDRNKNQIIRSINRSNIFTELNFRL